MTNHQASVIEYHHQKEKREIIETRIIGGILLILYILICALWFGRDLIK